MESTRREALFVCFFERLRSKRPLLPKPLFFGINVGPGSQKEPQELFASNRTRAAGRRNRGFARTVWKVRCQSINAELLCGETIQSLAFLTWAHEFSSAQSTLNMPNSGDDFGRRQRVEPSLRQYLRTLNNRKNGSVVTDQFDTTFCKPIGVVELKRNGPIRPSGWLRNTIKHRPLLKDDQSVFDNIQRWRDAFWTIPTISKVRKISDYGLSFVEQQR